MTRVLVPVRYPLTRGSFRTLREAVDVAEERDADLVVLHVDRYQESGQVTRTDLKSAVERAFGPLERTRYVVRRSFIVEQTILDEAAAERADVVVIGTDRAGRIRRLLRAVFGDPDVERFLQQELDCEVITVRN